MYFLIPKFFHFSLSLPLFENCFREARGPTPKKIRYTIIRYATTCNALLGHSVMQCNTSAEQGAIIYSSPVRRCMFLPVPFCMSLFFIFGRWC
uniref:Uncharacterized protein n=1 Tax=Rhipicephalus microplus TaxID=6941 RepID=A0A6G5A2P9_RHIMP